LQPQSYSSILQVQENLLFNHVYRKFDTFTTDLEYLRQCNGGVTSSLITVLSDVTIDNFFENSKITVSAETVTDGLALSEKHSILALLYSEDWNSLSYA